MSEEQFKKIFSRNLRDIMYVRGKSQTDLMKDLGLSSSTISSWCTGLKLPRMSKVQMLCDYLNVEKSDLLEDKGNYTLAAHKVTQEDWTAEELKEIENFKAYLRSKRNEK